MFDNALRTLARTRAGLRNSCSQIRITRQPSFRKVRVTSRSRIRFPKSFFVQKSRLLAGVLECFRQPCQKQPSTKTASRCSRNVKSGFPRSDECRRQPQIRCSRSNNMSAISVLLFPRPRIRDMTCDRFAFVKTSGIRMVTERGCEFQAPFSLVRQVNQHSVVQS